MSDERFFRRRSTSVLGPCQTNGLAAAVAKRPGRCLELFLKEVTLIPTQNARLMSHEWSGRVAAAVETPVLT